MAHAGSRISADNMLEKAAHRTIELPAAQKSKQWRRTDVAKPYKVSERTIDRWVKTGGLPGPGPAGCWTRNEILRRDRERE